MVAGAFSACDSDRTGRGRNNGVSQQAASVNGVAQKGPIAGANVRIFAVNANGTRGVRLGEGFTDNVGQFQLVTDLSQGYTGPVVLEATGGTFTDEATGNTVQLTATLRSVLPNFDGSLVTANITPLTNLAASMAENSPGGFTAGNITAANNAMSTLLGGGIDVNTTDLIDLTQSTSNTDSAARDYSALLGGISQLARELNLDTNQLNDALAADIADGRLDGRDRQGNRTTVDGAILSRLVQATETFLASGNNASGITGISAGLRNTLLNAKNINPANDQKAPKVELINPASGSTNVPTNTQVTVEFNEPMNSSTVVNALTVSAGGSPVAGTVTYDAETESATFVPANLVGGVNSFMTNTLYTVSVSTAAQDEAGNGLSQSFNSTFTTGANPQNQAGFTISVVSPSATGAVSVNASIVLQSSRPLLKSSLNTQGIVTLVTSPGGVAVPVNIGYSVGTTNFTVTPISPLAGSTTYDFTVSGSLQDSTGNALPGGNVTLTFTTEAAGTADTTGPTVAAVNPANGEMNFPANGCVTVTFNERMNIANALSATSLSLGANPVSVVSEYDSTTNSVKLTPNSPLMAGQSYSVNVTTSATDQATNALSSAFSSSFTVAADALSIVTATLPNGVLSMPYSQTLQTNGGAAPITFALAGGTTLPAGLSLDPSSGTISGTPSAAGSTDFTIRATDNGGQTADQAFTLVIDAAPQNATVSFALASSSVTENVAGGSVDVLVRLSVPNSGTLSQAVSFTVSDSGNGSATSGVDYPTVNAQTRTFVAGSADGATTAVTVAITDENLFENNETIVLALSNVTGPAVLGGASSHTLTITNDDPTPTLNLDAGNDLDLTEGDSSNFTVNLTNPTINAVSATYTVTGSAANADDTNLALTGTFNIPAGMTSASVSFMITDDIFDEDDVETLTITVDAPSNANQGTSVQTANVNDNDAFSMVSLADFTVDENNTASLTLNLDRPHRRSSPISVNVTTMDGSAVNGVSGDYTALNVVASFAANTMSNTSFSVSINDDNLDEDTESFSVNLSPNTNIAVATPSATVSINDNDALPVVGFRMTTTTVNEGQMVVIDVDLDRGTGKGVTVDFAVNGMSTATAGDDHTLMSGTLTFPATNFTPGTTNQQISFTANSDAISEQTETVIIDLSGQSNSTLGSMTHTVSINDGNGLPSVSFALKNSAGTTLNNGQSGRVELTEGNTTKSLITLEATLSIPSSSAVSVGYDVANGTASQPSDNFSSASAQRLAAIYVVENTTTPAVKVFTPQVNGTTFNVEQRRAANYGNNEGGFHDTLGNFYQAGDRSGLAPSLRIVSNVSDRNDGALFDDTQGDRSILGSLTQLQNPKGIHVDTQRERIFVAEFGAGKILVFKTGDQGNVAPTISIDATAFAGVGGGKPWDLVYDSASDRLYVAITSGFVAVFDNFLSTSPTATTPNRLYTIGNAGTQESVNLHGIAYDGGTDRLIVSDVGLAGDDMDGQVFVIANASTAGAAGGVVQHALQIVTGAGVRLGNPVDVAFDGSTLYVVEKTGGANTGVVGYTNFNSLTNSGSIPFDIYIPATAAESISLDRGQRRDHNLTSGTFNFAPGETVKSVTFCVDTDLRAEMDETVDVSIGALNGATAGTNNSSFQIQNDDANPTININSITVDEGAGQAIFNVTLTAATGLTVNENFNTADGTALSTEDYTAVMGGAIDFVIGERFRTIRIDLTDDMLRENSEDFTVTLSGNAVNATAGMSTGTATITDNDGNPTLSIAGPAMVNEADGTVNFPVSINNTPGADVSFEVALVGQSPTFDGNDHNFSSPFSGTFTQANGTADIVVPFQISNDNLNEIDEQFQLVLTITAGLAQLGTDTVNVTITDNDDLTVSLGNATNLAEPATNGAIPLVFSVNTEQTVIYGATGIGTNTMNDPAEMSDFSVPGSITASPGGATLMVTVGPDNNNEAIEEVTVNFTLQGTPRGVSPMSLSQVLTINDDDDVTLTLTRTSDGAEPSTNATFSAMLSGPSEQTIEYSLGTMGLGGTVPATDGAADLSAPGSVTFTNLSTTETVTVTVVDDMINEATESFRLTATRVGMQRGVTTTSTSADAVITDDDIVTVTLVKNNDANEAGATTPANFSINLSLPTEQPFSFSIVSAGNTDNPGTENVDYTLPNPATDSIPGDGATTSTSFNVTVDNDSVNEAHEGFTLTIAVTNSPENVAMMGNILSVDAVILDDDDAQLEIATQAASAMLAENGGSAARFNISLTLPTEQRFSTSIATNVGMSTAVGGGVDFQLPGVPTVNFTGMPNAPDNGTKNLDVSIVNDDINEANETFAVDLQSAVAAMNGSARGITVSAMNGTASSIIDSEDNATVMLTVMAPGGAEANGGTATNITFNAALVNTATMQPITTEQTINFVVSSSTAGIANPTATEGTDFNLPMNTMITFNTMSNSANFDFTVTEDAINEANEEINGVFTRQNMVEDFTGTAFMALASIADDDDAVFNISDASNSESDANVIFNVTLSVPSEQDPQVDFDTIMTTTGAASMTTDDATEGTDYMRAMGMLTFDDAGGAAATSQMVNVPIVADMAAEQNETLQVTIALTVNQTLRGVSIGDGTGDGTIIDDDDAEATVSATAMVAEGGTHTVTVNLSGPKSSTVTVDVTPTFGTNPGEAADPTDSTDTFPTTVAGIYAVSNTGATATVQQIDLAIGKVLRTITTGANEGMRITANGNFLHNGDNTANSNLRIFMNGADRDNFDTTVDGIIVGSSTELSNPKGIDIDSRRKLAFVANFGGDSVLIFNFGDRDNTAPSGKIDLSGTAGSAWDVEYDPAADRLFVALTNGTIGVFDNVVANNYPDTPDRIITPSQAGTKASVNAHGIVYLPANDTLIVSDVGSAGSPTDGAIFVITSASTVDGNVDFATALGDPATGNPMSRLGNPVDLAIQGDTLIVAEKANSGGLVLVYNNLSALIATNDNAFSDRAADNSMAVAAVEAIEVDTGRRCDTSLNRDSTLTVTIPAGMTSGTTSFTAKDDTRNEPAETMTLTLGNGTGPVAIGAANTQTLTINDGDVEPALTLTFLGTVDMNGMNTKAINEGNMGGSTTRFIFQADLAAASETVVTGTFNTSFPAVMNAADATDLTPRTGVMLTFAEGQRSACVVVEVNQDATDEQDEVFDGTVSAIANASPAGGSVTDRATITNDDGDPIISIDQAAVSSTGESGVLTFTISLSAVSGQDVTVEFSTVAGGTATGGGQDYTDEVSTLVTIPAGTMSVTQTVTVSTDTINEANETVNVGIANPVQAVLGAATHFGTINDDDDITISIADATQNTEGEMGTSPLGFVVSINGGGTTEQMITVTFATAGTGSATGGADYVVNAAGTATIDGTMGATMGTATVQINGDDLVEPTETFEVNLDGGSITARGVTVNDGNATGTIIDDDAALVSISGPTTNNLAENGGVNFEFTVSIDQGLGQDVTVTASTINGDAAAPNDFTGLTMTPVTFTEGGAQTRTLNVVIAQDVRNEADESFQVTLNAVTAGVNVMIDGANQTVSATIADDDDITINFAGPSMLPEGQTTNVTVQTSGPTDQMITFDFDLRADMPLGPNSASDVNDFTPDSGGLMFMMGNTTRQIPVVVTADTLNENTESLVISFSNINGAARGVTFNGGGATLDVALTITDDDPLPDLTVNLTNATVGEAMSFNVEFNLAPASGRDVTFDFATNDGTATLTPRSDYTDADETGITIPAGSNQVTRTVMLNGDSINEATETLDFMISNASGATVNGAMGGNQTVTGMITDDDTLTITIADASESEDTGAINFNVNIDIDTEQVITVQLDTTDLTQNGAIAGQDYTALVGAIVTFDGVGAFGTRTVQQAVTVMDEDINEVTESFRVNLSNASGGAVIGDPTAIGSITNDDLLGILIEDQMGIAEGAGSATFNVTLVDPANTANQRQSEQNLIVSVTVMDGDGTADPSMAMGNVDDTDDGAGSNTNFGTTELTDDIGPPSATTLTYVAGSGTTQQAVMVPINDDNVDEATEAFRVMIAIQGVPDDVSLVANGGGTPGLANATITDDDAIIVEFTSTLQTVAEGSPATFTARLASGGMIAQTEQQFDILFEAREAVNTPPAGIGTATDTVDFTSQTGDPNGGGTGVRITFNSDNNSQALNVTTLDDTPPVNEQNEDFEAVLSVAPGSMLPDASVTLGTNILSIGRILDNDVVVIAFQPLTVIEGNGGGTQTASVTIIITGRTEQTIQLDFETAVGGSNPATPDDFIVAQNTATIPADTMNSPRTINNLIDVVVTDDDINETNQTFLVRAINTGSLPQNVTVSPGSTEVVIDDQNDPLEAVILDNNATAGQVPEAGGNAMYNVVFRDPGGATNRVVRTEQTFNLTVASGIQGADVVLNAQTPADFGAAAPASVMVMGLSNNGAGQTGAVGVGTGNPFAVTVPIVSDTLNENNEDFNVAIGTPMGSVNNITQGTPNMQVTNIIDDDTLLIDLRVAMATVLESDAVANFQVFADTSNGTTGTSKTFTVRFDTMNGVAGATAAAFGIDNGGLAEPDFTGQANTTSNNMGPVAMFAGMNPTLDTRPVNIAADAANNDLTNEPTENFSGQISMIMVAVNNNNNIVFTNMDAMRSATQLIQDDDTVVIDFDPAVGGDVTEPDGGATATATKGLRNTGSAMFTAQRFDFTIGLVDGTAMAPADYVNAVTPNSVMIVGSEVNPAGLLSTQLPDMVTVTVNGDDINEADENFSYRLSGLVAGAGLTGVPGIELVSFAGGAATLDSVQNILDNDNVDYTVVEASMGMGFDEDDGMGGNGTATFNLVVTPTPGTVTQTAQDYVIVFNTAAGTAQNGPDYDGAGANGQTTTFMGSGGPVAIDPSASYTVTLVFERVNEADETFDGNITFMTPPAPRGITINGTNNGTSTSTATILDDDLITLMLNTDNPVGSGQVEDQGNIVFRVTNQAAMNDAATSTEQTFTIDFETQNTVGAGANGAEANVDYQALMTSATINPGPLGSPDIATFAVVINDAGIPFNGNDVVNEVDERFDGNIDVMTPPNNVSVGTSNATAEIADNDDMVLAIQDATFTEGTAAAPGTYQFSIEAVGGAELTQQTMSVDFFTTDGSAVSAGAGLGQPDFMAVPMGAPQTIAIVRVASSGDTTPLVDSTVTVAVALVGDDINEATETFMATINNLQGSIRGVTLLGGGASQSSTGTILDDDNYVLQVQMGSRQQQPTETDMDFMQPVVVELTGTSDADVNFTFVNTGASFTIAAVPYTNAETTDFDPDNGSGTVTAGMTTTTINVTINGDEINEDNEGVLFDINSITASNTGISITTNAGEDQSQIGIGDDDNINVNYVNAGVDNQDLFERGATTAGIDLAQRLGVYIFEIQNAGGANDSAMTEQAITIQVVAAGGVTNPITFGTDARFVVPIAGTPSTNVTQVIAVRNDTPGAPVALPITTSEVTTNALNYNIEALNDGSGTDVVESYTLTTTVASMTRGLTPLGGATLNGEIFDLALLDLDGAGAGNLAAVTLVQTRAVADGAATLVPAATVRNGGINDYDTGTLTIRLEGVGSNGNERINFGAGVYNNTNGNITIGAVVIGTTAAGLNPPVQGTAGTTTNIVITFNANATTTAIQTLIRGLTVDVVNGSPTGITRTYRLILDPNQATSRPAETRTTTILYN